MNMKVRTQIKSGGHNLNHNLIARRKQDLLKIRSTIKAGGKNLNHNATVKTAAS